MRFFMKDLPHHVKQLNSKVVRSLRREEEEKANYDKEFRIDESEQQKKKKAKLKRKAKSEAHTPHPQTPEERNELMNERVPITRPRSHRPPPNK